MDILDTLILRARKLGATQARIAEEMGCTQGAVSHRERRMRDGTARKHTSRPSYASVVAMRALVKKLSKRSRK